MNVEKPREPSSPAIEAAFDPEHGKHQSLDSPSRSQPSPQNFLDTNQRPFDFLSEALLPTELIASEEALPPLHHHGVVVVVLLKRVIPKRLIPSE